MNNSTCLLIIMMIIQFIYYIIFHFCAHIFYSCLFLESILCVIWVSSSKTVFYSLICLLSLQFNWHFLEIINVLICFQVCLTTFILLQFSNLFNSLFSKISIHLLWLFKFSLIFSMEHTKKGIELHVWKVLYKKYMYVWNKLHCK